MTTKLELVLHDIEELTSEEQKKVRETLERLLTSAPIPDEEVLLRLAEGRGIRVTLPTERISVEEYDRYEPIRILHGEPVSETIIRERR